MNTTSTAWWNTEKDAAHKQLFAWVNYVTEQNRIQRSDTRLFLEIAHNFNTSGDGNVSYGLARAIPYKIRENICRAAVDTIASLVSQSRTCPWYQTTDGEWGVSRIAEKRNRVLQAQLYSLGAFKLVPKAFQDACEAGTGYIHGFIGTDGLPKLEKCLPNEVYVDPEDGRYGDPNVIARVKFIAREQLKAQFSERFHADLDRASGPTNDDYIDFFIKRDSKADHVRVVEAWRRPTTVGGTDGRHVIACDNVTLLDEPFSRQRIPIVRVIYAERPQGYYGVGLVERILPAQLRLAELDAFITRCQDICSNPYWMIDEGSGFRIESITNAPGQGVYYSSVSPEGQPAQPPQLNLNVGTPPDLQNQRDRIKQSAFDQEGISSAAASGEVNKGLSSARAVRAADDVLSRRFITQARLLENAYLDVVRLIEDLNDECASEDPNYRVAARYRSASGRRTWLKTSTWTDLALSENDSTVTMFPISAQATTPQGKWSAVEEWVQAGFVSKPQAMDLMEFPDTEAFESLENADLDLVHAQIDQMIDPDGDSWFFLPIENQDLALAGKLVNDAFKVAYRDKAPQEVLLRFQNYLAYIKQLTTPPANDQLNSELAPAALNPQAAAAAQLNSQPTLN